MTAYYHSRVEYPDQKDPDDVDNTSDASLGDKTLEEVKNNG